MRALIFNKFYNINENVESKVIKVLDSNSNYLGIFKIKDALKKAKEKSLDLIEISKKEDFSICKIIKYGKFYYLEEKKHKIKKELKKNKRVKEIKFHIFTAAFDYCNKIFRIKKFLLKGFTVKASISVRGREVIKKNIIKETVDKIIDSLKLDGNLLKYPNIKERYIAMIFFPKNQCSK